MSRDFLCREVVPVDANGIIDAQTRTGTLYEICPDEFVEMGRIIGDRLSMDVIISDDEYVWLARCWWEATGRELKKPAILMLEEAVQELQRSSDGGDAK